jgi:O-antigen biosynthesis protein WbqP
LPNRRAFFALKRAFDFSAALIGLLVLSPLWLVIAVAIKRDSPGPVIFSQRRVGLNGSHFCIYKFRTMRQDTPDLPTDQMLKRPSPVTRVGAFLRRSSLDELPQLLNVLKGEMSLVGPRPALYNQEALIGARQAAGIHAMPPGITGWAQINGRDELPDDKKVALDAWYVAHAGFWLDLSIVFKTFFSIFSKRGVY